MRSNRLSLGLKAVAIFTLSLLTTNIWAATEKTLHTFRKSPDGAYPGSGLLWDADGNLYGTTPFGGSRPCSIGSVGCGTVFKLTPNGNGGWTEKTLHNFGSGSDGAYPSGLMMDAAGNLYGTTEMGGTYCPHSRCGGTVFEMTPNEDGTFTEKILHSFGNGMDGAAPVSGLIADTSGNLYGTTIEGGTHRRGTVFEMTPRGDGSWIEKTLHNFGNGWDGSQALASLIWDAAGNLYGTTTEGGTHGTGTVFEMVPRGDGSWTEKTLHNFGAYEGPPSGLIWDADGNLYGTLLAGGPYYGGKVFELMPNGDGQWTAKVLHNFGKGFDGVDPDSGLTWDADGNLYGTTNVGGSNHNHGTVFELMPNGSGGWTEKVVHSFGIGWEPGGGLIFDAAGNLYGTTYTGARYGAGTAFEIIP